MAITILVIIYISSELNAFLKEINQSSYGDELLKAIIRAYNEQKNGYEFIKVLTREIAGVKLPFTTIDNQRIVELRPKSNNTTSVSGDYRLIGWEENNTYFFTEIGMHKDINNILKVLACLGERYVQQTMNESISSLFVTAKRYEETKQQFEKIFAKAKEFYEEYEFAKRYGLQKDLESRKTRYDKF